MPSLIGLDIQGYCGLDIQGYEGLDTLKRADFLGPVQIVRQTISNLETPICPYHRYEGLSIARKIAGYKEEYPLSLLA